MVVVLRGCPPWGPIGDPDGDGDVKGMRACVRAGGRHWLNGWTIGMISAGEGSREKKQQQQEKEQEKEEEACKHGLDTSHSPHIVDILSWPASEACSTRHHALAFAFRFLKRPSPPRPARAEPWERKARAPSLSKARLAQRYASSRGHRHRSAADRSPSSA